MAFGNPDIATGNPGGYVPQRHCVFPGQCLEWYRKHQLPSEQSEYSAFQNTKEMELPAVRAELKRKRSFLLK